MNLNDQYAVKVIGSYGYITKDGEGKYHVSGDQSKAHTSWSRAGAVRMSQDYLKKEWNSTMGKKPTFEVVKFHRPIKINHVW